MPTFYGLRGLRCPGMASTRPGEVSASIAVLGLLVQQSDTVAGVRLRLDEEYPEARWQPNIVHNTMTSLVDQGLVDITASGRQRSLDHCEPTSKGKERIARWKHEPSVAPPERDDLRAKLKYVSDADELAARIRDIKDQEDACASEHKAALKRYLEARALGRLDPTGDQDLEVIVRWALMTDEIRRWHSRLSDLKRLRKALEDPYGRSDTLEVELDDG